MAFVVVQGRTRTAFANTASQGQELADCTRKLCPKGVNPLSLVTHKTITMTTSSAKEQLQGMLTVSFLSEQFTMSAAAVPANELETLFGSMKNIDSVEVSRGDVDKNLGTTYTITFIKWPKTPHENNLFSHDGSPPLSAFSCNTTLVEAAFSPKCDFKNVVAKGTLYEPCSGHGLCDEQRGKCSCEPGWNGVGCEDNRDAGNVVEHKADGPFFSGNIVALETNRDQNGGFNFVQAASSYGRTPIFTLAGNGNVTLHSGDLSLESGGLAVKGGEGLAVISKEDSKYPSISGISPSGGAAFYATGSEFQGEVMKLASDRPASPNFDFLVLEAGGDRVLGVTGEGSVTTQSGMTVKGTLEAKEAVIGTSGLKVQGKATALGGLEVAGEASLKGDIKVQGGVSIEGSYLKVHNSERTVFEVLDSGSTSTSTLSIKSGGLAVHAGGLDVRSGGLKVEGGLTLESGDMTLKGAFQVEGGFQGSAEGGGDAIVGRSDDINFSGSLLKLKAPESSSEEQFMLIGSEVGDSEVFAVTSDGVVKSLGASVDGDADVSGHLNVNGGTVFRRHSPSPTDGSVKIPAEKNTFISVNGDENVLIEVIGTPKEGQLLIVQNSNPTPCSLLRSSGSESKIFIPPHTLLMFVFTTPSGWTDLTAAAAHSRALTGVTSLSAVEDLDIGPHVLTAREFVSSSGVSNSIPFFSASKSLTPSGLSYDAAKDLLKVENLDVSSLSSDLDCKGNTLLNVALYSPKLEGVKHLNVDSLGILDMAKGGAAVDEYSRAVGVDTQGRLTVNEDGRWSDAGVLKLREVGGLKQTLKVTGDVHFDPERSVHGLNMAPNTTIKDGFIVGGEAIGMKLVNATAEGLGLGATSVSSLRVKSLASSSGSIISIGSDGSLNPTPSVRLSGSEDQPLIILGAGISGNGNTISDVKISSSTLTDATVEDGTVTGVITFTEDSKLVSPTLTDATVAASSITAGTITSSGDATLEAEVYVGGSLTVSGSVLGSGPYVDASDSRFKKAVSPLGVGSPTVLEKILSLEPVTYEVDYGSMASSSRRMSGEPGRAEIGLIAQEVESLFPELVYTAEDGYKGVAYSRLAAVAVQGVKDVWGKVESLEKRLAEMEARYKKSEDEGSFKV